MTRERESLTRLWMQEREALQSAPTKPDSDPKPVPGWMSHLQSIRDLYLKGSIPTNKLLGLLDPYKHRSEIVYDLVTAWNRAAQKASADTRPNPVIVLDLPQFGDETHDQAKAWLAEVFMEIGENIWAAHLHAMYPVETPDEPTPDEYAADITDLDHADDYDDDPGCDDFTWADPGIVEDKEIPF